MDLSRRLVVKMVARSKKGGYIPNTAWSHPFSHHHKVIVLCWGTVNSTDGGNCPLEIRNMKTICTKCKSENIYLIMPEVSKEPEVQTLDEMIHNLNRPMSLIYQPRRWACKDCGYSRGEGETTIEFDSTKVFPNITASGSIKI